MKKKCLTCQKRRDFKFYDTPRSLICQMCQIAKKNGIKKERKEASSKTWIKRLDALVGSRVRSRGVCESRRLEHKGVLQWAHICSRRYHATRWLEENALCLCAGCHKFYTDRPLEWEFFISSLIGENKFRDLKSKALLEPNPDYKELYKQLTKEPL